MDRRRMIMVIVAVLFPTVLIIGCSSGVALEDIYRFESECPVSGSAKNLAVVTTDYYYIIGGFTEDGKLITDRSLGFQHGTPGGLSAASKDASKDFVIEEIVLHSGWGIMLNQGYYHLGHDGVLPAQIPATVPPPGLPERLYVPCPDALGSENITVLIDSDRNSTKLAGLWWVQQTVVNVWEDGSVEVVREGLRAMDADKNWWVSKEVGGKIDAIVMVRDSTD